MDFRILGPLEVRVEGRPIALRGKKQRAILAMLLLHANQVVPRDQLMEGLWADKPPASGARALQERVSQLRKSLGAGADSVFLTREPGYMIRLDADQLDLHRFERLFGEASAELEQGNPAGATAKLSAALDLWNGPPLADLALEDFAQGAIRRLEELRLAALALRIEAELSSGHSPQLIGELERLIAEHPLHEGFYRQVMLALYRSGRQADALETYQRARAFLVDGLGIEPSLELQELERSILRHGPDLAATKAADGPPGLSRSILVAGCGRGLRDWLIRLVAPLALEPRREVVLARIVEREDELPAAWSELRDKQASVGATGLDVRLAAFTSSHPGLDLVRLVSEQPVDLLCLEGPREWWESGDATPDLAVVLGRALSDVAILATREHNPPHIGPDHPVLVPFGGAEHDWAAAELAAWIARSVGVPMRLLGTGANPAAGRRDASRSLARASLLLQRMTRVTADAILVSPGPEGIVSGARGGGLIVVGLSTQRIEASLGTVRRTLVRDADPPVLFVKKGLRPGVLAPPEALTRFSWSLTELSPTVNSAR